MSTSLHTLTELLRELPGIGPRQARRLALWIAQRDASWVQRLSTTLLDVRSHIHRCTSCMRLFESSQPNHVECSICLTASRDHILLVTEKDEDVDNIERTGTYRGFYFVLGGTTSPLDTNPEQRIRISALEKRIQSTTHPVEEIILALSATTEGEDTELYVRERLAPIVSAQHIRISVLGRGLSTGTELEYVDADTMKNALLGRHDT